MSREFEIYRGNVSPIARHADRADEQIAGRTNPLANGSPCPPRGNAIVTQSGRDVGGRRCGQSRAVPGQIVVPGFSPLRDRSTIAIH
jgi:hypothetical protein